VRRNVKYRQKRTDPYSQKQFSGRAKPKDREALFDDLRTLKISFNACQEENQNLKQAAEMYEKTAEEKAWIIKDLLRKLDERKIPIEKSKPKTHLIPGFKNHVKELQDELKVVEKKITKLKHDPKFIRLGEIEATMQVLKEENERLKAILKDATKQKNGGYTEEEIKNMNRTAHNQGVVFESMKADNNNLKRRLHGAEEQHERIKSSITQSNNALIKVKNKYNADLATKKELQRVRKEIEKLKDKFNEIKTKPKSQEDEKYFGQIVELLQKCKELKEQIAQQRKVANELEVKAKAKKDKNKKLTKKAAELTEELEKCEKELAEERKTKPKKQPLVKKEEINKIAWHIKLTLMKQGISPVNIRKELFEYYEDNDLISINEISKLFSRRKECKDCDTTLLARYLVEPIDKPTVKFNEFKEEKFSSALRRFILLLDDYAIPESHTKEAILEELKKVFKPFGKTPKETFESEMNEVSLERFEELVKDIKLTSVQKSYCVYFMYTGSLEKLTYRQFMELLGIDPSEESISDIQPILTESKVKEEEMKNSEVEVDHKKQEESKGEKKPKDKPINKEEYGADFEEEDDNQNTLKNKREEGKSSLVENLRAMAKGNAKDSEESEEEIVKRDDGSNVAEGSRTMNDEFETEEKKEEEIELNKDQAIEIAEGSLRAISSYMEEHGLTLEKLFEGQTYEELIQDQVTEVISVSTFLTKIKEMNIEGMDEVSKACLVKVLVIGEKEDVIRFADLEQALRNNEDEDPITTLDDDLNFQELDSTSMILMLSLTEYLLKSNTPLYTVFDEKIYNHIVRFESGETANVEIISSNDFFQVLNEIGINTSVNEHENLREFLSLGPDHTKIISVSKLKKAIGIFATDKKLREQAHKYCMEFLGKSELNANNDEEQYEQDADFDI